MVWQKSNATVFYLPQFFSNINVIPFKIVPLCSYTRMEMLLPFLVAALEIFNWYDLQHVCYTLLDVFQSLEMTSFEDFFKIRKNENGKTHRG